MYGGGLICNKALVGVYARCCLDAENKFSAYTNVYQFSEWVSAHSSGSVPSALAMSSLLCVILGIAKFSEVLFN